MMKPNNSLQKPLGNRKTFAASVSGKGHNRRGWKVLMPLFALGVVFYTLFAGAISAPAQGTAFTYQGHLSDTGQAANGSYDLTFTLFGSDSGGMAVADTLTNSPTTVSNGLFTVMLDFGANVFNGQPRWLEIAVRTNGSADAYTILLPRQALTATPYAITASNLSGTLPTTQLTGALPTNALTGTYPNAVAFNNPTNTFVGTFTGNGSGLTNLPAAQLAGVLPTNALTGTYPNAVTLSNPTNVFVGTFTGNGSGLTNLDAANLVSGKIADARLSSNVALLNTDQLFTGANTFAGATTLTNISNQVSGTFNGTLYGNVFGDGSGLTGLSATQLSAGTLSDTRLSVNVALLSTNQLFSGTNVFSNSGNNFNGAFSGSFSGDGSGLTNVNLGSTQPPPAVTPGLTMIWIKPGTFVMGSPTGEVDHLDFYEGPQMVVTLTRGFWMGQHLVTQGEYVTVVGSNPSLFTGDLNLPVESVTWSDATNYCGLLTQSERSAGRLPANWVYRLPTNAEWEYACRALTTTRTYWGDDPGYTNMTNYAWYTENSDGHTHPVGQKPANPWGLSDMQGNLWQWCSDWFEIYPGGSVTDPQGPTSSSWGTRVGRGGSWWDEPTWLRSAARYDFPPDNPNYRQMMGFRVVLALSP